MVILMVMKMMGNSPPATDIVLAHPIIASVRQRFTIGPAFGRTIANPHTSSRQMIHEISYREDIIA
jgi:hypothetical protein